MPKKLHWEMSTTYCAPMLRHTVRVSQYLKWIKLVFNALFFAQQKRSTQETWKKLNTLKFCVRRKVTWRTFQSTHNRRQTYTKKSHFSLSSPFSRFKLTLKLEPNKLKLKSSRSLLSLSFLFYIFISKTCLHFDHVLFVLLIMSSLSLHLLENVINNIFN